MSLDGQPGSARPAFHGRWINCELRASCFGGRLASVPPALIVQRWLSQAWTEPLQEDVQVDMLSLATTVSFYRICGNAFILQEGHLPLLFSG